MPMWKSVYIGTTNNTNNDNDEVAKNNYLTTQGNAITVTAVPSSSQADAKALLNEGAIPVPAIYTWNSSAARLTASS